MDENPAGFIHILIELILESDNLAEEIIAFLC
jgi:hypothetical protein